MRSSALDFLYPNGTTAVASGDVRLTVPVRVGVAFAPAKYTAIGENQKQELLERVAGSFRGRKTIGSVQVIPDAYLRPGGGFANVDQLKPAFGIDILALVSYDQLQLSETTRASWAYWTVIGAYIVKGEKNETRTVLEAVVYDIPSRAMLFHAGGTDESSGRATPVDTGRKLRQASEAGFDRATNELIGNLDAALKEFGKQAASGHVRGPGTPAIALVDESGQPVRAGAGALGLLEALLAAFVLLTAVWRRS
jgi:rhombotail lipoprotein